MNNRKNKRSKHARYQYCGNSDINKKAFAKTGLKQKSHILFGNKLTSDEMKKEYAKERKRIVSKLSKKNFGKSTNSNKVILNTFRRKDEVLTEKYASAYKNFDKSYRTYNPNVISILKPIEETISACRSFVAAAKKAFPYVSKVVAFTRLVNDGRKIMISIINIKESMDRLIDIALADENGIVPVEKSFKELVDIIYETRDLYNAIKDAAKQLCVITQ